MTPIKEFVAIEGEQVLTQIEGDAWNTSPNPLVQLLTFFMKLFWFIFGVRLRTYIIVTNLRIVEVERKTILWGMLPGSIIVLTLNKTTIQSVGYQMASSWFIFRKYYFVLANASGALRLTYKGNTNDLLKSCEIIDKVVTQK